MMSRMKITNTTKLYLREWTKQNVPALYAISRRVTKHPASHLQVKAPSSAQRRRQCPCGPVRTVGTCQRGGEERGGVGTQTPGLGPYTAYIMPSVTPPGAGRYWTPGKNSPVAHRGGGGYTRSVFLTPGIRPYARCQSTNRTRLG